MRVPVPESILPADELGAVHLVGIGGAGLSGIARLLLARGVRVSGSDGADSPTLASLREAGARVHLGHDASHLDPLGDGDTVVVSTAVRETNPEVVEAQRRGLRLLPRSAALAAVMVGRRTVAVAGTHGKTTTTSLLTVALAAAGADPAYAIGGDLAASGTNAADGTGELVAEADESDGAFLVYSPYAAIVTNVEADHLDSWGTEEAYRDGFSRFLGRIDPEGFCVLVVDDPGAAALADEAQLRGLDVVRVGESDDDAAGLDLRASDLRFVGSSSTFAVHDAAGRDLGEVTLRIPGRHYVLDALAALACGLRLGHDLAGLRAGLESFTGTRRRMEHKGTVGGVAVYDSYAHHPAEISGDLQAARAVADGGRVLVAFQPHLVSRTRLLGAEMGRALGAADEVVVLDVYLAREDADPAVTGALVADACPLPAGAVRHEPDRASVPRSLARRARPGDVVLTLGAGDVTELAPLVLVELGRIPGAGSTRPTAHQEDDDG